MPSTVPGERAWAWAAWTAFGLATLSCAGSPMVSSAGRDDVTARLVAQLGDADAGTRDGAAVELTRAFWSHVHTIGRLLATPEALAPAVVERLQAICMEAPNHVDLDQFCRTLDSTFLEEVGEHVQGLFAATPGNAFAALSAIVATSRTGLRPFGDPLREDQVARCKEIVLVRSLARGWQESAGGLHEGIARCQLWTGQGLEESARDRMADVARPWLASVDDDLGWQLLRSIATGRADAERPLLLRCATDGRPTLRCEAVGLLNTAATPADRDRLRRAWIAELGSAFPGRREAAARSLGRWRWGPGELEWDILPALSRALNDASYRVRYEAAAALAQFGTDAAPVAESLVGALGDPIDVVSHNASGALEAIGPPATDALLRALHNENGTIRALAVAAFSAVCADAEQRIRTVAAMLGDPEPAVRRNAAEQLYRHTLLPPPGSVCIPGATPEQLRAANRHRDLVTRLAVPALALAANDSDYESNRHACHALAGLGAAAAPAIPALLGALEHYDHGAAAVALGGIGSAAVPALLNVAETHADPAVRSRAVRALAYAGPVAFAAAPMLLRLLREPVEPGADQDPRLASLEALAAIAPGSPEALVALFDALDDSTLRGHAQEYLRLVGHAPQAGVPALARWLRGSDPTARDLALEIVTRTGEAAAAAAPDLAALLHGRESEATRKVAAIALAGLGAKAAPAVDPLIALLADDGMAVSTRGVAAWALGTIGHAAVPAVPALLRAYALPAVGGDWRPTYSFSPVSLHRVLDEAIVAVGAHAVPALTRALDDPALRGHALRLLARLRPDGAERSPVPPHSRRR